MRKTIIIGNWKMNKGPKETQTFMNDFTKLYAENKGKISKKVIFGIGAPSIDLVTIKENSPKGMLVAAETMHFAEGGAFTGELSVKMIKEVGANAVILGHSERRAMFNETDEDVNKKVIVALANKITPIICVGETLAQYETKKSKEVVKKSIEASLKGITKWNKVVIAYEPVWAIGTGKTATSDYAEDMCKYIRSLTSDKVLIQYGGSVKPGNIEELLNQPNVDGALVGGASLVAESFIKLLTNNK